MGGDRGKKGKKPPEKGDEQSAGEALEEAEKPVSLLARLRPRRRVLFFIAFVGFCLWIMAFHDPCKVDEKSRRDCGFAGISNSYCMTASCFTSRGGKLEKKTIKVSRKKGANLGLEIKPDAKGDLALVQAIGDGAVQEHNSQLAADSPQRINVGDALAKVDGSSKGLAEALSKTTEKTVELEIRRSSLPSYLKWLRTSAKPGRVETVLTAPGFKRWSKLTSQLGTLGFASWLLSGYGPASLPVWYFGFSAAVGYKLVRCCHDDQVQDKVPHCYRPVDDDLSQVIEKARAASIALAREQISQWRLFADELVASYKSLTEKEKKKDKKKGKKEKEEI